MNNASNSGNFTTAIFADCLANSKEIFQLIDQVFPLDSCQHYEVLPLKLVGSNLIMGMLAPTNQESLKFVNSIAKVFKYDLEIQLIDQQTHQIILSNYPQNSVPSSTAEQNQNKTVIDTDFRPSPNPQGDRRRRLSDSAPTIISPAAESASTSIADEPELPPDLDFLKDLNLTPPPTPKSSQKKADSTPTLFEIPPEFLNQSKPHNLDDKPTIIGGNPAELLAQETALGDPEIAFSEAQISDLIAETLGKVTSEPIENADFLPQLKPQLSWQKLLEQAFRHQTEYISLSRHSDRGSIIAHQNESTQSAIEQVPLPIFCSLIDEIKRMARLPQTTSSHPKKVVLERFSEQERILLRLEFSIQEGIETVGIQILRNKALEIYEQQQMDKVSEQALQLAKQLEKTLRRIQACFDTAELTNLRELQTVHTRISHQLRLLDKQ
ncbi:MAG: hypothetical protein AAGF83_05505 [Cyanobacteria bacterium P01_G01_bin.67]